MSKKKSMKRSRMKRTDPRPRQKTFLGSRSRRLSFLIILVLLFGTGVSFLYGKYDPVKEVRSQQEASAQDTTVDIAALRGGELRPTLQPSLFRGKVAKAYAIAEGNRDLLDSIYCYCHCKTKFDHKSLLTCFTDTHAVECKTCLNQAVFASSLFENGLSFPQVRRAVDQKFWRPLR